MNKKLLVSFFLSFSPTGAGRKGRGRSHPALHAALHRSKTCLGGVKAPYTSLAEAISA